MNISGVQPDLAVLADHEPRRSETGIGALMPWANRLWMVTYVAHTKTTGAGTGLFWLDVDDEGRITRTKHPESRVGTYANRIIHRESNQLFIGPHAIDTRGNVRTIDELVDTRLAATARHLSDPEHKVYVLGMEGELFEVDVESLEVTKLFDLLSDLDISDKPHFKDAYTDHGRLVVVNNSYYPADWERGESDGRLAEWDGSTWRTIERTQYNTVTGRCEGDLGRAIYAVGQDRASALLSVYLPATGWRRYRLPKATHTQDHAWTTEWPRIREIESERWLVDASGMFYEMPAMTYGNALRGLVPVSRHLRIIGDYCTWRGMLVMAGDQTTPIHDSNPFVGQPQANLWFGKSDDLWNFGTPAGWGGPWWDADVTAGEPSDPFLFNGFRDKGLHLSHEGDQPLSVRIELDVTGTGRFHRYDTLTTSDGYAATTFPAGLAAHWVRLVPERDAKVTAQFFYG